jgi:hypothetical protein
VDECKPLLAGAHRAGTSGISCAMYFMRLKALPAVHYVKVGSSQQ